MVNRVRERTYIRMMNNLRKLVKAAVVLALVTCLGIILFRPQPVEVTDESFKLGTVIRMSVYGRDKELAEQAVADANREISRYEKLFSVNVKNSDVDRINKHKHLTSKISPETEKLIIYSLEMAKKTNGAFDPTIGPVVSLWGIGTDKARVPSPEEINKALSLVDYRKVSAGRGDIILTGRGQKLDLGAVAKGWIADRLSEDIKAKGINSALLDLGGNIMLIGKRPNLTLWRIGLQHPALPRGNYFAVLRAADKSIVTSGPYERFFEKNGVRYHHIFDTATGYPAKSDLASVTIVSETSAEADVLCTALYSMGLERSLDYISKEINLSAVLVSADCKTVYITKNLKKFFTLRDTDMKLELISRGEER